MRILVTGSRNFNDAEIVRRTLDAVVGGAKREAVTLVHGAARGADTLAAEHARRRGWRIEPHAAQWGIYGKRAGIVRNVAMVELGADVCVAFPLGESRGTRHCMSEAMRAGIPVVNATEADGDRSPRPAQLLVRAPQTKANALRDAVGVSRQDPNETNGT